MHHSIDTRQIIMHTVIAFHQDKYLLFLVCVYIFIYCSVLRTVGHFLKLFRPMFMVVLTLLRPHYSPYSRELKGKEPRSLDNGLGEFVCRAKFWYQVQVTRRSLQLQKVSPPFDARFDAQEQWPGLKKPLMPPRRWAPLIHRIFTHHDAPTQRSV